MLNRDYGLFTSDFLLLQLNCSPADIETIGAVYAGWDNKEFDQYTTPSFVGIHHPNGDIKKISKGGSKHLSTIYSYLWKVYWDKGITAPGSSGSPLFNANHQIIGQLRGGYSDCSHQTDTFDYYGKFSHTYYKIENWLDPYHCGATSLSAYDPTGEHCSNGILDANETGVDCGGPDCPPCSWVNGPSGWFGISHCVNGILDSLLGETGIDCGGECRPCGTQRFCQDCLKNGDEAQIDCGGSCVPCEAECNTTAITYTSTSIPNKTTASDYIQAQGNAIVSNTEKVEFRASNEIILKTGFIAYSGSDFKAIISPCKCKDICNIDVNAINAFTPNGDGINDVLKFDVCGVHRFDVNVFCISHSAPNSIYTNTGIPENGKIIVWDGSGKNKSCGFYRVELTLYSNCSSESKFYSYNITILWGQNESRGSIVSYEINEINKSSERIKIYPNPTSDKLIIEHPISKDAKIIVMDIAGRVVYISGKLASSVDKYYIDLSSQKKGMYLIKLFDQNNSYVEKIILE